MPSESTDPAAGPTTEPLGSSSTAEELRRAASAQLVHDTRREALAWERAARALTALGAGGTGEPFPELVLRALLPASDGARGLLRTRIGEIEGEVLARVGCFGPGEEDLMPRAPSELLHDPLVTVTWLDQAPGARAGLLLRLHRDAGDVTAFVEAKEGREPPSGGELRAIEFLATGISAFWRGHERATRERVDAARVEAENEQLRFLLGERSAVDAILGSSAPARALRREVARLASGRSSVLVQGPPGSGKAFLSRVLHFAGPFARGRWVRVRCDALAPSTEHEVLFGARAGTPATWERLGGSLAAARGGTLYLDAVHALPIAVQASLYTLLATPENTRERELGLVLSSHVDLAARARAGTFFAPLFSLACVATVRVPALEERREDVTALFDHFLASFSKRQGKPVVAHLSPEARAALDTRRWPGNVREVRECAERAVLLTPAGEAIHASLLGEAQECPSTAPNPVTGSFQRQVAELERSVVERALRGHGWNISQTARALEISRQHLHNLVRKHALQRP